LIRPHSSQHNTVQPAADIYSPYVTTARTTTTMPIRFVLMVNKQGQTRLAKYFEDLSIQQKNSLEGEIVRKCLQRNLNECSFIEYRNYKCIYRRYASLFFIVGVSGPHNELAILEFIHNLVECLDRYYENVCELDIMFSIERAHFIVDEMVMNGEILETNKSNILRPILLMDKHAPKTKN
jgi:AP-4 complex subunit sigma-1